MTRARIASFAVLACLAGCRGNRLFAPEVGLVVEPASLTFPTAFVGFPVSAPLSVRNTSRVDLRATVEASAPFSAPGELEVPAGATVPLEVRFAAASEGPTEGSLTLRWDEGAGAVEVALIASAQAPLPCPSPGDCREVTFDPSAGRCGEAPSADGTSCPGNRCLTEGRCLAGSCVGTAADCDDHDECTLDSCDPTQGCRHEDTSARCPGAADSCHVAFCDKSSGCGIAAAGDGTSCGPNDCLTAQVCMAGRCEVRVPPEGTACSAPTPCQGEGVCRASTCVRPEPSPLAPLWRYQPAAGRSLRFGGQTDPEGNVYFAEGDAQVTELVSLDRGGAERFRVELRRSCPSCMYYVDLALEPAAQRLFMVLGRMAQARSMVNGQLLWEKNLTLGIPVYNAQPDGGGSYQVLEPMLLGGGLVGYEVAEGYTDHHAYVTALDRGTGQQAWQIHKKGHMYGPGVAGTGELWLSSANCWAPAGEVVRVSTSGQQLASRFIQAIPGAYGANEGWLTNYTDTMMLSSSLADSKLTLGTNEHVSGYSALLSGDRIVFPTYQASSASTRQLLSDVSAATRQKRWSVELGPLSGTPDAELTLDGGVIASVTQPDGGAFVLAVDSQGVEQFRCPLPGVPSSPMALLRGRYVAQLGADVLAAFELPGYDVELSGWVAMHGNLERTRAAR